MQKIKNIIQKAWIFGLILLTGSIATAQENAEAFRWKAPEPGPAREIQLGDYEQFSLNNGLRVILVENNKLPRVSYSLSLVHNPVLEGDKAGYVSISGDLLGRGTSTMTKAEIDEAIDFIGASFNTSANGIFGSSLTKHQDAMLEVFTDVLYNPSFPEEELNKIVTQVMSGLAQAKEDPQSIANNVSSVLNYSKEHPYGEVETEETVQNVTIEDCRMYYDKYFRPDNAILTIVGDIDMDKAKEEVNKFFAQWEKPAEPLVQEEMISVRFPESTEVAFAPRESAVQSLIQIGYPVELAMGSADAVKVSVMNTILGGGSFMGRLMQNLREDKAYTYGARSSIGPDQHIASFTAFASVRNEVTDSAIVQFLYEMDRMIKENVTEEDLSMAKSVLSGSFARSMESPQTIARFAYNTIRYNYPADYYQNYLQNLEAVSIEDVREMAKKYIRPDRAHIVVVGNKAEVADKLKVFDGNGEIDFYDAYGNKVDMSASAAPVDMTAEDVVIRHIEAVGGMEKMAGVQSIKMVAGMNLMGQDFEMTILQKDGKFYQKMGNESMTIQEQVFDGEKAKLSGMGGSQMITEGEELEAIRKEARMFSVRDYLSEMYTLELSGVEKVDGKDAYKVIATDQAGKSQSNFFDKESLMLVKNVSTQEANGQTVTVATKFSDFHEYNGLKFAKKMAIVGGAPFPINMEFKTIEINGEVDDKIFEIK
jgi:predicted Zn-dependent peptidase